MLKKSLVLFLAVFMALGMASVASAAPVVFLELAGETPTPDAFYTEILPGESFDVSVYINIDYYEYAPNYLLGANVAVNETTATPLLDFTGLTNAKMVDGNGWWTISNANLNDTDGNDASFSDGMYMGLPDGNLLLGTIHFSALMGPGLASLETNLKSFSPAFNNISLDDATKLDDSVTFLGGQVNVVPIPGAVLLLGSGLLGLVGIKRRFRG